MRVRGQVTTTPLLAWRLQLATLRLSFLWVAVLAVGVLILVGDTQTDLVVRLVRVLGYVTAAVAIVALFSGALTWYSWRSRFGATQHVDISESRVMVQTGDQTLTVPWGKVRETRRTHAAWVLSTGTRQVPVPRSAFSAEDAAAVDRLIVEQAARVKERALQAERDARAARQKRRAEKKARGDG